MENCLEEVKKGIQKKVDDLNTDLRQLALKIHMHPETGFEEHKAVNWLSDFLGDAGFRVRRPIAGLETAFEAVTEHCEDSDDCPKIAFIAEYDALPGLGHACGHNIVAVAAAGAARALQEAFPDLPGRIAVLGTPAEEGGGGKVLMCEEGVFDDVDLAMMCHPANRTLVAREGLACVRTGLKFYGRSAHAATNPEKGVSALDAMLQSISAINSLRQFVRDGVRIHGVIVDGGDAPNIVPEYCKAEFLVRAPTLEEMHEVKELVYRACRSSAAAVGARFEAEEGMIYAERNNNCAAARLFGENLQQLGIEVEEAPERGGVGSSDIGNVGRITATIHPYIKICREEVVNHSTAFREAAGSEQAMWALNQSAKALAMTALDVCLDKENLHAIREEFNNWKSENVSS